MQVHSLSIYLYIYIQDAGALTYDEVVLNSDNVREYYLELLNKTLIFDFSSLQKIGINSEGYSVMNTGQVISSRHNCSLHSIFLQTQRLPGYGQLGNVVSVCV